MFRTITIAVIGDSRARVIGEWGKNHPKYNVVYQFYRSSVKTVEFLQHFRYPHRIPVDTEVVIVNLLQCDFTYLDAARGAVPREYVNIPSLLIAMRQIQEALRVMAPNVVVVWSVPIVPNLINDRSARSSMTLMAAGLRFLMTEMRSRGFLTFDLSLCFMAGERRVTYMNRYVPDSVHPNYPGISRLYSSMRRLLIKLRLVDIIIQRRNTVLPIEPLMIDDHVTAQQEDILMELYQ